jgi:hypothetical protein
MIFAGIFKTYIPIHLDSLFLLMIGNRFFVVSRLNYLSDLPRSSKPSCLNTPTGWGLGPVQLVFLQSLAYLPLNKLYLLV